MMIRKTEMTAIGGDLMIESIRSWELENDNEIK